MKMRISLFFVLSLMSIYQSSWRKIYHCSRYLYINRTVHMEFSFSLDLIIRADIVRYQIIPYSQLNRRPESLQQVQERNFFFRYLSLSRFCQECSISNCIIVKYFDIIFLTNKKKLVKKQRNKTKHPVFEQITLLLIKE